MSWLSSALNSVVDGLTGRGAAERISDTSRDVANEQTRLAEGIYRDQRNLQMPFRDYGLGAINQQRHLLGLEGYQNGVRTDGNAQYAQALQEWEAAQGDPSNPRNGQRRPERWEFANTQENIAWKQDNAFKDFENSGFARTMAGQTDYTLDRITDRAATFGNALSGANLKDLHDHARRDENAAFGQYWNALGGGAVAGQNATNAQQQAGSQYGATQSNIWGNLGNSLNSAYAQQGAQTQGLLQNALGGFGQFGQGQGWFG